MGWDLERIALVHMCSADYCHGMVGNKHQTLVISHKNNVTWPKLVTMKFEKRSKFDVYMITGGEEGLCYWPLGCEKYREINNYSKGLGLKLSGGLLWPFTAWEEILGMSS